MNTFNKIKSSDLKVGDIAIITEGETFPADFAVLSTSSVDGTCFIKTSSLDGEKNLKKRFQCKGFDKILPNKDLEESKKKSNNLSGHIEVGLPDKDLHRLDGSINI